MDSRDQARRLPDIGAPAGTGRALGYAQRPRPGGGHASPPRALRTSPFSSRFRLAFAIVGLAAGVTKSQLMTVNLGLKGKTRHCDSRMVRLRHAQFFYE